MNIIYEDDQILVINKPSGVVVNRSDTNSTFTVQDFIESETDFETDDASEFGLRSGIVHRLDKDTSGVLLAAKNAESFENLQSQFKNREVHKEYHAIVLGKIKDAKFEVDAPLGRNPKNRLSMAVVPDGRPSQTKFELVDTFEKEAVLFSYIKAFPYTGRTHQIRVHAAAINFPVACDEIYCTRSQLEQSKKAFNRLMLHALSISFIHPTKNESATFTAPLPNDFVIS